MSLTEDQLKVKALLAETVTLLCKNGLKFTSELRIEGLIGVTVDNSQILLVNINEAVLSARSRAVSSGGKSVVSSQTKKRDKTLSRKAIVRSVSHKSTVRHDVPVSKTRNLSVTGCQMSTIPSSACTAYDDDNYNNALFSDDHSRTPASKRRRRTTEPEQTLTLMVEDELLGDPTRGEILKIERNRSDESEEDCDELKNSTNVFNEAHDKTTDASNWLDGQNVGDDADAESTEVGTQSAVEIEAHKSSGPTTDYLECYTCPVCGLIVRTSVTLRDHIAGKHGEQPRFVCSCCGKKFKWRSTFFYHRKSCHPSYLS